MEAGLSWAGVRQGLGTGEEVVAWTQMEGGEVVSRGETGSLLEMETRQEVLLVDWVWVRG